MSEKKAKNAKNNFAQKAAAILLNTQAVIFSPDKPFTLTSGRKSPLYVDCRRLIAFPQARASLMDMGVELLGQRLGYDIFDCVAGGETAGIPFAAFLAERMHLPMAYIRKKPKGFGRNARIEGNIQSGEKVLLVEDLATDGGSKLSFIDALRDAGAWVEHCFVIFHYGTFPQADAKLREAGLTIHSLASWADILELAQQRNILPPAELAIIQNFLANPEAWDG